ncbi:sugar-specific transcriptional regulator TrmB [archaeon BMS3Abin16]|nr:sugar-specific transcriptional regulator TrmB [archaeon BMS3Abin16]HDY73818.1 winged helix-turn-helix transcriptional regulator [Euryarchaeota archaeon]
MSFLRKSYGAKGCYKPVLRDIIVLKKLLLSLLIVSLFISSAHAQEIVAYRANAEVDGMLLKESVTITVFNNHELGLARFTYPFSGQVENLKTFDDKGGLESSVELRGGSNYVTTLFRTPLTVEEQADVLYEFSDPLAVTFFNGTYILSTSFPLLANVKIFDLTLRLPEGTGLNDPDVDVVPAPSEITSDGRAIILKWTESNPRDFRIFVRYAPLPPPVESTTTSTTSTTLPQITTAPPADNNPLYSEGLLLFLSILMLLTFAVLLSMKLRARTSIQDKIEILKEDEQRILTLVAEEDGIEQREIQRRTDYSKTKVSKILSELEKRGAIRKESMGKKNKIYLTQKLKE